MAPTSSSSGTYTTQAIVLRTRNLGEKDRIMTLFSPEGRFSAVAKGARGAKSKMAAVSQPFVCARFLLARGRSLDIATQAEIEWAFPLITTELIKTAWASYLCELCDMLPEHQPDHQLFETLCRALQAINVRAGHDDISLAGHWFEARFLMLLGYTPIIGHCASCGSKIRVPPGDRHRKAGFSAVFGGTLCEACAARDAQRLTLDVAALRIVHKLTRAAEPPLGLLTGLPAGTRRGVRDCLRFQLTSHLDAKLKSRRFLDDILAGGGQS